MADYELVYEVAGSWSRDGALMAILFGAIFLFFFGSLLYSLRSRGKDTRFLIFATIFAACLGGGLLYLLVTSRSECQKLAGSSDYRTVEGIAKVTGDSSGGQISVSGVRLMFPRTGLFVCGYQNTVDEARKTLEGRAVRIGYVGEIIMKIEAASK